MAVLILALVGGAVGAALLSDFGGFVFGLVVGAVAGSVVDLASTRGVAPGSHRVEHVAAGRQAQQGPSDGVASRRTCRGVARRPAATTTCKEVRTRQSAEQLGTRPRTG